MNLSKPSPEYVRKVSSRFEYILLIFALRLEMTLKVVGVDAELNSLSNGSIFKGVIGQKIGLSPKMRMSV
jgi:hypothetical protein